MVLLLRDAPHGLTFGVIRAEFGGLRRFVTHITARGPFRGFLGKIDEMGCVGVEMWYDFPV